jgi:hypothetical protein
MRQLTAVELTTLLTGVAQGCAKKTLMDAVAMCGTEHCITLMVQQIKSNTIDPVDELSWYTTLAFVPKPNLAAIAAIDAIIDRVPAAGLLFHYHFYDNALI